MTVMRIPETPRSVGALDLMKLLEDYAEGRTTWYPDQQQLGSDTKKACRALHTNIVQMVDHVFAYVLDRATSHEMDTFTMHDRMHGLKVAHLMWHILSPERRAVLSPPEIALMVFSAHLHDAGMALSREERFTRLSPDSDLWDKLEINLETKSAIENFRTQLTRDDLAKAARIRTESELFQAEQFLLALDTRERHATPERYRELLEQITEFHEKDKTRIPDVEHCFSFEGDSFRKKLIDICASHNQDADVLIEKDREAFELPRFPEKYPVGCATADLQMVAGALRLADILDFDRERTPAVLFHYLLPTALSVADNISVLEWSKHLAISNWEIGPNAIVFRGRSNSHVVHHAIVQFVGMIESEIASTRATFEVGHQGGGWPFQLPDTVKTEIVSEGYTYLPYRFELDDQRVYQLLMGRAIYSNPLDAIRELIQNAVDACSYRDALTKLTDPHNIPDTRNRITVTYEESDGGRSYPLLTVTDTGTGMDAWVIDRFFLKVGRSYYSSGEFLRDRVDLRKQGYDFAPVSEFGIGFLSSFLLADRVEVETAMWEPVRGDIRKRHLQIDGPTRLIKILESPNEGLKRFRGTRVKLHLSRTSGSNSPTAAVNWEALADYVRNVCQELPYRINLRHVTTTRTDVEFVDASPLSVAVPPEYAEAAYRIPLEDRDGLIEGELAIVPYRVGRQTRLQMLEKEPIKLADPEQRKSKRESTLLRGGFAVGPVPGLPTGGEEIFVSARVRLQWDRDKDLRHMQTNLARTGLADRNQVARAVFEAWMRYLLEHRTELSRGFLCRLGTPHESDTAIAKSVTVRYATWLEEYDALTLYELARDSWVYDANDDDNRVDMLEQWEQSKGWVPMGWGVYGEMLDILLPKIVAERRFDSNTLYIGPPVANWREILRSWSTFISEPVRWSQYLNFVGKIQDLLCYEYRFNSKYADSLSSFADSELRSLASIFSQLLWDRRRSRSTTLGEGQLTLLRRAIDCFGDLQIGSSLGTCRLSEFAGKTAGAKKGS